MKVTTTNLILKNGAVFQYAFYIGLGLTFGVVSGVGIITLAREALKYLGILS